jgi:hypothetical protein
MLTRLVTRAVTSFLLDKLVTKVAEIAHKDLKEKKPTLKKRRRKNTEKKDNPST